MIIAAFPSRAINAPYAANTVITLIWKYLLVSLLVKTTKKYFSHNALLVTTTEYTQRNANYAIKFMSDKLKTNFLLDGLTTVRFGKIITHKTTLIKLLFCFISIITTKTSLVLIQTFLNATMSYFYRNLDITITLILAKANGSEN